MNFRINLTCSFISISRDRNILYPLSFFPYSPSLTIFTTRLIDRNLLTLMDLHKNCRFIYLLIARYRRNSFFCKKTYFRQANQFISVKKTPYYICMPIPLAPDPIRVQSCVFGVYSEPIEIVYIYLSIYLIIQLMMNP